MKRKFLNLLLIVTSPFGYLEWGSENSMFLFQGEWEVLVKLFQDPVAAAHPFTLMPLLGQILLLITLFQKGTEQDPDLHRPGMLEPPPSLYVRYRHSFLEFKDTSFDNTVYHHRRTGDNRIEKEVTQDECRRQRT